MYTIYSAEYGKISYAIPVSPMTSPKKMVMSQKKALPPEFSTSIAFGISTNAMIP